MANNDLIMRFQWEAYMSCGSGNSAAYNLIGEGFTTFPESKNPKEYTRKYINYKTEKTDVIGYSPSIAYSCECIEGEPVIAEIINITDNELLGNDTHRDIVSVNCWSESGGVCEATKRTYAIIPDTKGDGTDALVYSGTMKAVSDIVVGKFNRDTKEFTENSSQS